MPSQQLARKRIPFLIVVAAVVFGACLRTSRPQTDQGPLPPVAVDTAAGADSVSADSLHADSLAADSARLAAAAAARQNSLIDSVRAEAQRAAAAVPVAKRPARECVLDFSNNPPDSRALVQTFPDSSRNVFIGGGFYGTCQGDNNTIKADSLEYYETAGIMNLYGNVVYIEPNKVQLTAAKLNYFRNDERFFAEGDVTVTQAATGSIFTGPVMEYYRAVPGVRDSARLFAPGHPKAMLRETDSTGKELPPVIITSMVMESLADSLLFAWGSVQLDRENIHGTSDSASFDQGASEMRLIRGAKVISSDPEQSFELTGDTIQLFTLERELTRVVALHQARAVTGQLEMTAGDLDLRLSNRELEMAFAYGAGRAKAVTSTQELEADSLVISLRNKSIRELRAIGQASAIGKPDTTKIKTDEMDLLYGDSVFAMFDTTRPPEDTTQADVREIQAIGSARSLFHIASRRGRECPPSLNYARGAIIRILFDSGAVKSVQVDSNASGVFLEPVQDSLDPGNVACGGSGGKADTAVTTPPDSIPPGSITPPNTGGMAFHLNHGSAGRDGPSDSGRAVAKAGYKPIRNDETAISRAAGRRAGKGRLRT